MSSSQQPPPSSSAAATADNNNDTNSSSNADIDTNNFSIIRGRIIRKRKYHDHISFAIRSLVTTSLPSPPLLIMIPRNNDPTSSFSLDGIFIGTIIEATVEVEVVEAVTTTITETTTEKNSKNKNKTKSNNNNHQLAKSFKIIGCSPDPNAIQVCLNLVFGTSIEKDDENENKPPKKLLPVSIFSYYDHDNNNNNNETKSAMIPLFRDDDLEVIQKILELNSKDPILRKSFISRLSRALKGEDKAFTLVVDEDNSSSGEAIKLKNDGPRKRLTHVKHRQKQILQKMEVSQSPLEDVLVRTITVDGEENDEDDVNNDNNDNEDDDEKEPTLKSKVIVSSSLSEPSSEKVVVVVPNIPKGDPYTNTNTKTNNNGNSNNTMNMMSIRHPRTRIEYLIDKKYPQIQWLLQRMSPIIDNIRKEKRRNNNNDHGKEDEEEEEQHYYYINVLDVGGGRGDIAVAVAQEFHDVKITVVDMNESSLQAGKEYYEESMKVAAKNRKNSDTTTNNNTENDDRAHFICDDFAHFAQDAFNSNNNNNNNTDDDSTESTEPKVKVNFDIVIAWHACGDLSDYALEYSIRSNIKAFLINPCCYTKRYIKTFTPKYIRQYYNYCSPVVVVDNVDDVNHDDVNNDNEVNINANNKKESAPEATTTATIIATTTTTTTTPFDNEGMTKNTTTNTNTNIMTTNEFKTKNKYNKNGSNSHDNSYGNSKNNNQQDSNQPQDKYQPQDKNQQHQQQVNVNNNDIKIIQKLAEINERPEYTSRAMRLINTMRIKSLLVLQNELNLNSKPSTTTTTTTMIPTATPAAAATTTGTSLSSSSSSSSLLFDITLEEYNIEYSSKNLVLVGIK